MKMIALPFLLLSSISWAYNFSIEHLNLKKGSSETIELPSNPTTGYRWLPRNEAEVKDVISVTNKGYTPSKPNRIGSGAWKHGKLVDLKKLKRPILFLNIADLGKRIWSQPK